MGSTPPYDMNPLRTLGRMLERRHNERRERIINRTEEIGRFAVGRRLTQGEIRMIEWMFGSNPGYARARIYPRNFWWPFRFDRAMAPQGDIFFPRDDFHMDFSAPHVRIEDKGLFMHESTHLYQWYELNQIVWLRGMFDRNYNYTLIPGKKLRNCNLEQIGSIVQDYYILRNGGRIRRTDVKLEDYSDALPVSLR